MKNDFLSQDELKELGLKSFGENVLISRDAKLFSCENISLGNNVRIDAFCILSGKITIGNYVHIAAGTYLYAGDAGIEMKDYSCLSSRCAAYAITDDYSGNYMTNSTVDDKYKNIIKGKLTIGKHSVIGTGSTILPGVQIGEGCSFGAMSLINKSTDAWGIYVGIPCKRIKERSKKLLELTDDLFEII